MATGLRLSGAKLTASNLKAAAAKEPRVVAAGMYLVCSRIMADSKDNYVPVDTGQLKASGRVLVPKIEGKKIIVIMTYGGGSKGGAVGMIPVYVHEDPWAKHPIGQYKFLVTPMMKAQGSAAKDIAEYVKKNGSQAQQPAQPAQPAKES